MVNPTCPECNRPDEIKLRPTPLDYTPKPVGIIKKRIAVVEKVEPAKDVKRATKHHRDSPAQKKSTVKRTASAHHVSSTPNPANEVDWQRELIDLIKPDSTPRVKAAPVNKQPSANAVTVGAVNSFVAAAKNVDTSYVRHASEPTDPKSFPIAHSKPRTESRPPQPNRTSLLSALTEASNETSKKSQDPEGMSAKEAKLKKVNKTYRRYASEPTSSERVAKWKEARLHSSLSSTDFSRSRGLLNKKGLPKHINKGLNSSMTSQSTDPDGRSGMLSDWSASKTSMSSSFQSSSPDYSKPILVSSPVMQKILECVPANYVSKIQEEKDEPVSDHGQAEGIPSVTDVSASSAAAFNTSYAHHSIEPVPKQRATTRSKQITSNNSGFNKYKPESSSSKKVAPTGLSRRHTFSDLKTSSADLNQSYFVISETNVAQDFTESKSILDGSAFGFSMADRSTLEVFEDDTYLTNTPEPLLRSTVKSVRSCPPMPPPLVGRDAEMTSEQAPMTPPKPTEKPEWATLSPSIDSLADASTIQSESYPYIFVPNSHHHSDDFVSTCSSFTESLVSRGQSVATWFVDNDVNMCKDNKEGVVFACGMPYALRSPPYQQGTYTGQIDITAKLPHGLGTFIQDDGLVLEGIWKQGDIVNGLTDQSDSPSRANPSQAKTPLIQNRSNLEEGQVMLPLLPMKCKVPSTLDCSSRTRRTRNSWSMKCRADSSYAEC